MDRLKVMIKVMKNNMASSLVKTKSTKKELLKDT